MGKQHKYKAFISYSHQDQKFAKWLHKQIENYKIPKSLREKYPDLPKDLKRSIFIDDEELPIAAALPDNLSHALESSEILIVVSSPGATESYWVGKEIAYFKQYHGEDRVLAILKEGEPNATYSTIYDHTLEAFPRSLRYRVDNSGEPTEERTEPLAADARKRSHKKKALLKLIAGILKVDFADLWEREKRETRKRWTISGALLVLFVAMGICASVQFAGEQSNKELERINTQIATIEYSIRHDELPVEKVIALNKELKKLKQDKENKEASIEALGKLKTSLGKKAQKVYDKKGADAAIEVLTSKSALANQENRLKELSKEKLTLAKLYVETYRFDEAKASYQKAINLYLDYENGMEYGFFLKNNNHFVEAISIIEKLKKINLTEEQKSVMLKELAVSYIHIDRFKEAEKELLKALEILIPLAETDPDGYSAYLSQVFNALGGLYWKSNRYQEAEEVHLIALNIKKSMVKNHPDVAIPYIATTLANLALLYKDTNQPKKAEKTSLKALKMQRSLAKKNPDEYNPPLAMTLHNLVSLYINTDRLNEAKETSLEALKIQRSLAKNNPEAYNPLLASILHNLAWLYANTNRPNKAEELYLEVLRIQQSLAKNNPNAYNPHLARALSDFALYYMNTNRFKEAEEKSLEALKIQSSLAKNNPDTYNPYLLKILINLITLYKDTDRFIETEELYLEVLRIQRSLAKNNPDAYIPDTAVTLHRLAWIYANTNRPKEAEEHFLEALKIRRSLAKNNPDAYNLDLAATIHTLAWLYTNIDRLKEAEELYLEALKLKRSLVKSKPDDDNLSSLQATLFRLANLYRDTTRTGEAIKIEKELLEMINQN